MARILLVDDHDANREILRRRLQAGGHTVFEAADGLEAVTQTLDWRPDLILMDLSMPGLDGIEAWRTICEHTDEPPPVIALTAVSIEEVRLTCAELGFKAFLTKPVNFAVLLGNIEQHSRRRAAEAA